MTSLRPAQRPSPSSVGVWDFAGRSRAGRGGQRGHVSPPSSSPPPLSSTLAGLEAHMNDAQRVLETSMAFLSSMASAMPPAHGLTASAAEPLSSLAFLSHLITFLRHRPHHPRPGEQAHLSSLPFRRHPTARLLEQHLDETPPSFCIQMQKGRHLDRQHVKCIAHLFPHHRIPNNIYSTSLRNLSTPIMATLL
ncbi:hypothetical protein BC829DRAFT_52102 [Chytridium lagenaria]|nr:hypothetical protein BC829DRAFT_52102 [Chytridium lagenaria]